MHVLVLFYLFYNVNILEKHLLIYQGTFLICPGALTFQRRLRYELLNKSKNPHLFRQQTKNISCLPKVSLCISSSANLVGIYKREQFQCLPVFISVFFQMLVLLDESET